MKYAPKLLMIFLAASCAFSALADTISTKFSVGYNEAWTASNYSNWLASNSIPNLWTLPSAFDPNLIKTIFEGMNRDKVNIARIWLFPNMQGVVIDPLQTPQTQGLYSSKGSQNPEMIVNLKTVFDLASQYGIRLYLSALDANSMKLLATPGLTPNTLYNYYTQLLNNPYEMEAYHSRVIIPILDWIVDNKYTDLVYAFDIINEIEAAIFAGYFPYNPPKTSISGVPEARNWISNMIKLISKNSKYKMIPLTAAAGWGNAVSEITLGFFSGLGLSFYDVHVYSDTGNYPGQQELCDKVKADNTPIILGEFGQLSKSYDDNLQQSSTYVFLFNAKNSCFSGALAWKYEGLFNTSIGAQPQLSYMGINIDTNSPNYGQFITNCSLPIPGPTCPRPAYNTIRSFSSISHRN